MRNVAIVAHVDHGKTTLVDTLLQASGTSISSARVMDSEDLEKERGITILSKSTSLVWGDTLINIVDTPGHADFGGEVERILSMVDGVVLLVDINEGVMAQTKFVVKKALNAGLHPIVVLNKVDRCHDASAQSDQVTSEVFDLFDSMGANEEQLDFSVVFSSAKNGWAISGLEDERQNMTPLLNSIVEHVPSPKTQEGPFSMLVTMMEHDDHFGSIVTGRVESGTANINDKLKVIDANGNFIEEARLLKIMARRGGMSLRKVDVASCGDIVTLAGLTAARVTHTVCHPDVDSPLPSNPIDPPTISMTLGPNTSPLAGKSGTKVTASHIHQRLVKETATNVSLVLRKTDSEEAFEVCGRGPLQMGILVENMRREGFELNVSPPKVLYSRDDNGNLLEPVEELTLEVDDEHSGHVIQQVSMRKGELLEYVQGDNGRTTLKYLIPARALLGFQHSFLMDTHGTGIMHHLFHGNLPYMGDMSTSRRGALISTGSGRCTAYALGLIEPRGVLFISEGIDIYAGMIIGEHAKSGDLEVNPCREKKLTNIRAAGTDEKVKISPPRVLSLEEIIAYMQSDELIEVTPDAIRLRKRILDSKRRKSAAKTKIEAC